MDIRKLPFTTPARLMTHDERVSHRADVQEALHEFVSKLDRPISTDYGARLRERLIELDAVEASETRGTA